MKTQVATVGVGVGAAPPTLLPGALWHKHAIHNIVIEPANGSWFMARPR